MSESPLPPGVPRLTGQEWYQQQVMLGVHELSSAPSPLRISCEGRCTYLCARDFSSRTPLISIMIPKNLQTLRRCRVPVYFYHACSFAPTCNRRSTSDWGDCNGYIAELVEHFLQRWMHACTLCLEKPLHLGSKPDEARSSAQLVAEENLAIAS